VVRCRRPRRASTLRSSARPGPQAWPTTGRAATPHRLRWARQSYVVARLSRDTPHRPPLALAPVHFPLSLKGKSPCPSVDGRRCEVSRPLCAHVWPPSPHSFVGTSYSFALDSHYFAQHSHSFVVGSHLFAEGTHITVWTAGTQGPKPMPHGVKQGSGYFKDQKLYPRFVRT